MDIKKLISALSNREVTEAFVAALQPTILASIHDLKVTIDNLRDEIAAKDVIITNLKSEVDCLRNDNSSLSKSLSNCETRLDLLETYTRVDNLVIKGLPEMLSEVVAANTNTVSSDGPLGENSDTTMTAVLQFCDNALGVQLRPEDISIAHRLPKGKNDRTRPVMVRFSNRRSRDAVYVARRSLHSAGMKDMYINEHLTKHHEQLFAACRKLRKEKRIHSTWTWHGITHVKLSQTSRMIKIQSDDDISKLPTLRH